MDFKPTSCPRSFTVKRAPRRQAARAVWLPTMALAWVGLMVGCSPGTSDGALSSSNTQAVTRVTLVLSSDANDQLTAFDAVVQGITLTDLSGKSVTVLSQSLGSEFVHINGRAEPLVTVTLPQGTYDAATVSIGGSQFTCVSLSAAGGLQDGIFAYGYVPAPNVSVSVPAPLSITGDSLGLTLRMQVPHSAVLANCSGGASYAITPAFTLTAFDIANAPLGSASTAVFSLEGAVTAIDAASRTFEVQRPAHLGAPATSIQVSIDDGTAFQGIGGPESLAAGMFVDLDGGLQADGSVHATRVAVADPAAVNVRRGPILTVFNQSIPIVNFEPIEGQGNDGLVNTESYDFSSTSFRISGRLSNLQQLPFAATFDAAAMTPGQNIYVSSPAFVTCCGALYYAPATTITLMPQTIDGTVIGSSMSGQFAVYTVELANSDLFAILAAQTGQATSLTQPNQVQVYVDTGTRMLNSSPVAVGGIFRFYGLVFNDLGVLRMDCAQINDGVSPTSY